MEVKLCIDQAGVQESHRKEVEYFESSIGMLHNTMPFCELSGLNRVLWRIGLLPSELGR